MSDITTITNRAALMGAVIAQLRDRMRPPMLQQEMASLMALSPSAWSRVEKGETALTAEQLGKVVKLVGISPNEYFELVEEAEAEIAKRGVSVVEMSLKAAAAGAAVGTVVPLVGPVLGGLLGLLLSGKFNLGKERKDKL